jgi:hypothetical protein
MLKATALDDCCLSHEKRQQQHIDLSGLSCGMRFGIADSNLSLPIAQTNNKLDKQVTISTK